MLFTRRALSPSAVFFTPYFYSPIKVKALLLPPLPLPTSSANPPPPNNAGALARHGWLDKSESSTLRLFFHLPALRTKNSRREKRRPNGIVAATGGPGWGAGTGGLGP